MSITVPSTPATPLTALRVALVGRDPVMRAGVAAVLTRDGDLVVGSVGGLARGVELTRSQRPDVVLLASGDVALPDPDAVRALRHACPATVVVLLGRCPDAAAFRDVVRAGGAGYLTEEVSPGRLGKVLAAARRGEPVVPRAVVAELVSQTVDAGSSLRSRLPNGGELTDREVQVLELLLAGHSTAGIAQRLFVAPVTVRTHLSTAMRKLKAASRTELQELVTGVLGDRGA